MINRILFHEQKLVKLNWEQFILDGIKGSLGSIAKYAPKNINQILITDNKKFNDKFIIKLMNCQTTQWRLKYKFSLIML